ncbi:TPA: hypothetical protein L4R55_005859, partial [Pseudomonas aeruginosa]|nr:hypothetical protein [Pseudomonas aeruginosa]HCR1208408.1 hypothetical protein [Pseudomonas aeruginosa]HCR1776748.1 hypothetical protein [Pseudomonas aeruginosa]
SFTSKIEITSPIRILEENHNNDLAAAQLLILPKIDEALEKIDTLKPSWLEKVTPGALALFGVLLGGLINRTLQKKLLEHNKEESDKKLSFDIKIKTFEYRNKQINDFYGPLLILLNQSKEQSNQLHENLIKLDRERYRYATETIKTTGEKRKSLYITTHTLPPKAFRLIEELPNLGINFKICLPQVKVIIETGERVAKLIEEKSGLCNPTNIELNSCLGRYLAHLSALKDAYKQAKHGAPPTENRTYSAAFPREIEKLTRSDYDEIIKQIKKWEYKDPQPQNTEPA